MKAQSPAGERFWGSIIAVSMLCLCFVTIYPFLYCLAYSLSDSIWAAAKGVTFLPVRFTLANYQAVLQNPFLSNSFLVSVGRTVLGSSFFLIITGLAAYAMTNRELPGNRAISLFLIIPMYISSGLLPYYVLIYKLGLFNNFLVYILPHGFYAFYMLVMRAYFETIPVELFESAKLDGASEFQILRKIVFPLSKPILATVLLFQGVWQWNSWFDAMLFVTKNNLLPMQTVLQRLLHEADAMEIAQRISGQANLAISPETLKMATIIVTILPIICVYPFLQRYFVKGIMLGAVKA